MVQPLRDMGACFSFSGSVTWERNVRGRNALMAVPLDRLLIETDAPDIRPYMPQAQPAGEQAIPPNEPANLLFVLRAAAELRGLSPDEMAEITWNNSCRFFGRS